MGLHPFLKFKWRVVLFSNLVVRIINDMERLRELELQIRGKKSILGTLVADYAKSQDAASRGKARRLINTAFSDILSRVEEESVLLKPAYLDEETIHEREYKELRRLEKLFEKQIRRHRIKGNDLKEAGAKLLQEAGFAEGQSKAADLQMKNIIRRTASTATLSKINLRGDIRIELVLKRMAIKIGVLYNKLKAAEKKKDIKDALSHLERMIGITGRSERLTGVLLHRLKDSTLENTGYILANLRRAGIVGNEQERKFAKVKEKMERDFAIIERQAISLRNEMNVGARRIKQDFAHFMSKEGRRQEREKIKEEKNAQKAAGKKNKGREKK